MHIRFIKEDEMIRRNKIGTFSVFIIVVISLAFRLYLYPEFLYYILYNSTKKSWLKNLKT